MKCWLVNCASIPTNKKDRRYGGFFYSSALSSYSLLEIFLLTESYFYNTLFNRENYTMLYVSTVLTCLVIIAGFLIGIALFIIGVDLASFPTVFKCDKLRDICYRERRHFWSSVIKKEDICALSKVRKAEVLTYIRKVRQYYVALKLKNGSYEPIFNSSSSSRVTHEKDAEKINAFLEQGQQELSITDSFFFPGIFLIFSGSFLLYQIFKVMVLSG